MECCDGKAGRGLGSKRPGRDGKDGDDPRLEKGNPRRNYMGGRTPPGALRGGMGGQGRDAGDAGKGRAPSPFPTGSMKGHRGHLQGTGKVTYRGNLPRAI